MTNPRSVSCGDFSYWLPVSLVSSDTTGNGHVTPVCVAELLVKSYTNTLGCCSGVRSEHGTCTESRLFGTCRCLFLSDNHVIDFPDMSLMPHLHTLELARNHLTTLGLAQISSAVLCCLDLSHNQLTSVSQLHRLPCLRELTVSDNQLTSLEGLQVSLP